MVLNTVSLIGWIILVIYAADHCYKNKPVHPFSYFCAVFICLLNCIQKFYM